MPLSNIDAFLDIVRKSGLLEEGAAQQYVARLRAREGLPDDAKYLANCMVRDAVLSQFQADQLVAGKWRGFNVAKYKVLEKIGIGGMGQVYLAEHKMMRHRVALKVLPRSKSADPSSLERFYREAKAGAALDHANIVRAFDIDFDQSSDLHYLVMEYVDGSSMQELVKIRGPLDYRRAAHYIYHTALGLQHAHNSGLIHRDIKPSNVLVDRAGNVKILDMGLARFFNDDQDMITKKYDESVLGTADYLAPEQAVDSHAVDTRADIYSLGCTFYFMLTGQPPFGDGSVAQKLIWHQTRRPKNIKDLRPDLPDEIVAILEKMMAKSPAERYQKPKDVAEALHVFGEMAVPPPTEDELPKLSPLARMAPDVKRPQRELVGSSAGRRASSGGGLPGDDEDEGLESNPRQEAALSPTKRTLESTRETPAPGRPEKLTKSGPQRFGTASQESTLPRGVVGKTGGTHFETGPARPGGELPPTVRSHRQAVASRPERNTDAQAGLSLTTLNRLAVYEKYKWIWICFGIIVVLTLIILNIYFILQASDGGRRRGEGTRSRASLAVRQHSLGDPKPNFAAGLFQPAMAAYDALGREPVRSSCGFGPSLGKKPCLAARLASGRY